MTPLFSTVKWAVCLMGVFATLPAGAAPAPPPLVIRHASVFMGGEFVPSEAVVVTDGRIQRMVPPGQEIQVPTGAIELEAKGRYLLPGFIDAHAHIGHVLPAAGVKVEEILPLYLATGITTLRGTGDTVDAQLKVQTFIEANPARSPRLVMASPLFDKSPPYHAGVSLAITDPAQVPAFVASMAEAGVWTFKIYVGMERSIGSAIIREAHRHGRWTTVHLRKYKPLDAIADGIDCLEHIESVFNFVTPPEVPDWPLRDERTYMSAMAVESLRRKILEEQIKTDFSQPRATELIRALVQHRVAVNPTLVVYQNWMLLSDLPEVRQHPDLKHLPARLVKHWNETSQGAGASPETQSLRRKQFAKLQELTAVLHRAGVELLVGTDAPFHFCPPGFALHQELELLVASGIPPAAALVAVTKNNARSVNLASEIGEIAPGRRADLVLLDANPITDIRNTRRIAAVIRGGILCDPTALLRLVPAD